jgi:hypothetical protein
VTVSKPVLIISGYIINDDEGRAEINELLQATDEDPEFSRHFELIRPSFNDTDFKGFRVRAFSAEYEIKREKPEAEETGEAGSEGAAQ